MVRMDWKTRLQPTVWGLGGFYFSRVLPVCLKTLPKHCVVHPCSQGQLVEACWGKTWVKYRPGGPTWLLLPSSALGSGMGFSARDAGCNFHALEPLSGISKQCAWSRRLLPLGLAAQGPLGNRQRVGRWFRVHQRGSRRLLALCVPHFSSPFPRGALPSPFRNIPGYCMYG